MQSDSRLICERYMKSVVKEALGTGTMTVDQLREYLIGIDKGNVPVSVDIEDVAKTLKKSRVSGKPNPYNIIIKKSKISGMAGGDWETGIQNREYKVHADDPDYVARFKAEPLWKGKGERVSPLLAHHTETGEYYLAITDVKSGKTEYIADGEQVERATIADYLPPPASPQPKQLEVGIRGEDQKQIRYPKLRNIKKIRINNVEIEIV